MGPWAITLLMILGFGGFAALAWRKIAIFRALQPEVRWDDVGTRLARVLAMGFGQSRMVAGEWKPGIMHAAIFLGFCALLVRKLHLIVIGYDPLAVIPGAAGAAYAAFKDFVEVAVLAAVAYAFWRRFVVKPRRLEPNREAILILSLILVIIVSDFLFDGLRFVIFASDAGIAHERAFAPVGAAVASLFEGASPAALAFGLQASYWVQMITVFSFLVLLPLGEHFHIVTALPAVFLARETPLNRVPSVDLEAIMADDAGDDMKVGREDGRRPRVEGRLRRLHLHRVRTLQGFLPHLPHRQAAGAQVGERFPQAPPAREARGDPRGPGGGAAGAGARGDQGRDALGLHHLRLLRARLPHRAGAPRALLPPAPAPGDDGGRLPAGAEGRLRRLREPVQPVGAAGRHARRVGEGPGRPRARERGAGEGDRLALLRGLGAVLRQPRAEDRPRVREDPAGRGRALRDPRAPPRAPRASACAAPATRCSSSRSPRRSSRR